MMRTRGYTTRNELTSRYVLDYAHPTTPGTVTLSYDKNGNLTSDGQKYDYVYNPFGQLVAIKLLGTGTYAAKYTYNGLGHRISEQTDTNNTAAVGGNAANSGVADGLVNSDDKVFYLAVDMQGRRVATYRNTDTYPKETFVYHPDQTGYTRGPGFSGGVMLRDRNSSLTDPKKWDTETAGSSRAERNYYCADSRGNVVALVSAAGALVEQYRYTPTGLPYGIPLGDLDNDGTVASGAGADGAIALYLKLNGYNDRGDLDQDGDVDGTDINIVGAGNGITTARGKLSAAGVGNRVGFGQGEVFGEGFATITNQGAVLRHVGMSRSLTDVSIRMTVYWPGIRRHYIPNGAYCVTQSNSLADCLSCCAASRGAGGNADCDAACNYVYGIRWPVTIYPPGGNGPSGDFIQDNPQWTDAEACAEFNRQHDQGFGGGVICRNGRPVSCFFPGNPSSPIITSPGGDIIKGCALENEDTHHGDMDCGQCAQGQICRPGWKRGINPMREECASDLASIECAVRRKPECDSLTPPDDKACKELVDRFIGGLCRTAKGFCGAKPPQCP